MKAITTCALAVIVTASGMARAEDGPPSFAALLTHPVALKPELVGVHPRVFVTAGGLEELRKRARTTHRDEWQRVLANLSALRGEPPPAPGPQERRSQNNVAYAIAEVSLAYAVDRRPEHLAASRKWVLAAIDYEPWGYTYYKPNVDLAAGHLLYAIGWAYDLLHADLTPEERARIRASLERHARLVHDYFAPRPGKRLAFTQNHDFIPTAGLGVAALALLGESEDAPRWAALARAHHHRAGQLLSPDGYYYEGFEYWIFSAPWLVHFLDAWEHATGENLWEQGPYRRWPQYLIHALLPDGQQVFDFGDIWEGPLTRAGKGRDYGRAYPGGTLQSNYNVLYRVAARFRDPVAQAVAARYRAFGHSNLEEYWTLLWRDPSLAPAAMESVPLAHHFEDSGVAYVRSSWGRDAAALAFRAAPPEGHRALALLAKVPEWEPSAGHSHPDANSFIFYAGGRYLTGDTGYAGLPLARHHNTLAVEGRGQGVEGKHDVWEGLDAGRLAEVRIREATFSPGRARLVGEAAGAYAPSTGLRRFTRTLTFTAPDRVEVLDEVETDGPKRLEWYLHADAPFEAAAGHAGPSCAAARPAVFVSRSAGTLLEVTVDAPAGSACRPQATRLKAPGRPGSIEHGTLEERGYELEVQSPPGTVARARFVLRARPDRP